MLRKTLFWIHLTGGVAAGLFIFSSAVTGMMLAFEPQLVEWSEKDVRTVVAPGNAVRLDLETLAAKAQAAKPKAKVMGITLSSDPQRSAVVAFGKEGSLYVNPYTGEVLGGASKTHKFLHGVEDWHRWLVKKEVGKPITGACALIFVVLASSGIYIWWPRLIIRFNFNLTGKARDFNWHNVIGFWFCCFLLVISSTGVIMSYSWANSLLFRATGNRPPPIAGKNPESKNQEAKMPEVKMANLDQVFAQVVEKTEGAAWASINIRLPQKAGGTVAASIQEEEPGPGIGRRSQLTMSASGEVMKWEPFSEWNSGRKARTWARYLHTGEAGGIWGQMLVFLAALGATFLVWTGLALSLRRFRAWRSRTPSAQLDQEFSQKKSSTAQKRPPFSRF